MNNTSNKTMLRDHEVEVHSVLIHQLLSSKQKGP